MFAISASIAARSPTSASARRHRRGQHWPSRDRGLRDRVAGRYGVHKVSVAQERGERKNHSGDVRIVARERQHNVTRRRARAGERLCEPAPHVWLWIIEYRGHSFFRLSPRRRRELAMQVGARKCVDGGGALWRRGLWQPSEETTHKARLVRENKGIRGGEGEHWDSHN